MHGPLKVKFRIQNFKNREDEVYLPLYPRMLEMYKWHELSLTQSVGHDRSYLGFCHSIAANFG